MTLAASCNGKDPAGVVIQPGENTGSFIVGSGLTKREYFAAGALQGLGGGMSGAPAWDVAMWAVSLADALLEALEE